MLNKYHCGEHLDRAKIMKVVFISIKMGKHYFRVICALS